MLIGLFTGLGAALSQSLSYLGARHFNHNRPHASRQLLVLSHWWMGLFGTAILLWQWPGGWSWLGQVWMPVLAMVGSYLLGQIGMTLSLRYAEPSRVSPLMGIKIIFLAILSSLWAQPQYDTAAIPTAGLTAMQWSGVILSVGAAIALNFAGTRLPRRAVAAILLACFAFTFSDWNIAATNKAIHQALPSAGIFQVMFLNVGLCYTLAALPALLLTPFWGTRRPRDWLDASPFAIAWFAGMVFLYWCIAEVGPLLGAILQSTRGLMSILIGTLLIYFGHLHMEPHSPRRVLLRRLAAGSLMFLAVCLYVLKDPTNIRIGSWHPF